MEDAVSKIVKECEHQMVEVDYGKGDNWINETYCKKCGYVEEVIPHALSEDDN
jgi:heterodisulfide reductase subunit A-like polyferredoxin